MAKASNLWLLLVCIVLFSVGGFFTAMVGPQLAPPIVSVFAILLLALPSYWFWIRAFGLSGAALIVVLGVFAFAIETLGVLTGFPYGVFEYGNQLGLLLGVVPWTVFFGWTPLVLGCVVVAAALIPRRRGASRTIIEQSLTALMLLVLCDAVLDPGAVAFGFWTYEQGGWYYGVPLINYFGWLLSGAIGIFIVQTSLHLFRSKVKRPLVLPNYASISAFCSLVFWSVVAMVHGHVMPALIGVGLCALFGWVIIRGQPAQEIGRVHRAGVR